MHGIDCRGNQWTGSQVQWLDWSPRMDGWSRVSNAGRKGCSLHLILTRDCVRVSRLESRHHSLLSLTHRDLPLSLVSHERSIY